MHAGKKFRLSEALFWTRRAILKFLIISTIPTVAYAVFGMTNIAIPWLPIALIGTAVAFLVGFKNNATYDRLWEARKIWGGIVNSSRTWAIMSRDFLSARDARKPLSDEALHEIHQDLVYRHLGWLTALRFQLRQPRAWESMTSPENIEYKRNFSVQELETKLEDELRVFLDEEEVKSIIKKTNVATQLISNQSEMLKRYFDQGLLDNYKHAQLENVLKELYDHQGKSERIKNFPYPRQFATLNLYFVWLFIILIPFGMLQEFHQLGDHLVWLTIPFSTLVSWVFHTMEKIGESTENPFQGGANDIPVTSLVRTIEIDLREMLGETKLPPPIGPVNNILM